MRDEVYPERFHLKVAPEWNDAIAIAARAQRTTRSDYVRRAVEAQLKADGLRLAQPERVPA
jgi:uncharacterized protein (DUF1778 family)